NTPFRLMPLDGLAAIVDYVQKNLLDLMRIDHRHGQVGVQVQNYLDVAGAQLVLQEIHCRLEQLIQGGKLALGLVAPRKAEQILNDLLAPLRALVNELEVPLMLRVGISPGEQLGKTHYRS